MKNFFLFCLAVLLLISALIFFSFHHAPNKVYLVQDTKSDSPEIKHWRSSKDIFKKYSGNTIGLKTLWMSGSKEPSAAGWETIKEKIIRITHGNVKHIIDVDLRQESHGYLHNKAITLYSENDWINRGKPRDIALQDETTWLQSISAQSEEAIVKPIGFDYVRFTVTDHLAPDNEEVDRFVKWVSSLPVEAWLHFHCRAGKGRTTTFMAMYDMLLNADKISFAEIIRRQASVDPFYDLSTTSRKADNLIEDYRNRKLFLIKFYAFSRERLSGYTGSWLEWMKIRGG